MEKMEKNEWPWLIECGVVFTSFYFHLSVCTKGIFKNQPVQLELQRQRKRGWWWGGRAEPVRAWQQQQEEIQGGGFYFCRIMTYGAGTGIKMEWYGKLQIFLLLMRAFLWQRTGFSWSKWRKFTTYKSYSICISMATSPTGMVPYGLVSRQKNIFHFHPTFPNGYLWTG